MRRLVAAFQLFSVPMKDTHTIVGRGNRDGAALFQNWFTELNHTAESGGQAAYVFVMGSMAELLRVFDLPIVMPEINSLQTAVRRVVPPAPIK